MSCPGVVEVSASRNAPPKTGWAKIVTELHVADLDASLAFWRNIIGFEIAFGREEEKFVYLEHPEGQQIMLCQRHGRFETGPMSPPLGQGAMFQIYFRDIGSILARLVAQNWPIYLGPRQVWRRTGDRESGQQEVFVQDPDGYLLMLAQSIGERFLAQADLTARITDENRHEEIDTGPPRGHEFGSGQTLVQSEAFRKRLSTKK
jgi:catechol 2,3-dioxygenase-like lactoylglutathione lyase family enzyme